jgi:hypothetical protein
MELGRVCELVPRRPANATTFNRLLFAEPGAEWVHEGLSAVDLRKCVRRLDALAERVGRARPQAPDGELVKAELLNSAAMARLGCRRGLAALSPSEVEAGELRRELQHVIGEHERLWLARNRPGGLHESSGRLRRRLDAPA